MNGMLASALIGLAVFVASLIVIHFSSDEPRSRKSAEIPEREK